MICIVLYSDFYFTPNLLTQSNIVQQLYTVFKVQQYSKKHLKG
jgi:hypothetical protein